MAERLPPAPPQPRFDSLPPGDREWLVGLIHGVEARMVDRLGDHDAKIERLESLRLTLEGLALDVRAVLASDSQQERRLGAIEIRMLEASKSAGSKAGLSAGAVGTALAAAAIYIIQQFSGQHPPPVTPHRQVLPEPKNVAE